jgi:zinc protease
MSSTSRKTAQKRSKRKSAPSERKASPAKRRVRRERAPGEPVEVILDNGLRALLVERSGLPIVASTIWYRVGSRDERTGQTGCSHLLEHMMFKGTARYAKGEIDQLTSRMGGSNNAFTDHDTTAYWFALAADRWERALEIEADRMTGCALDPGEFEAEKSVVLEELAMYDDDPWQRMWAVGEATAFHVHPYHHPIIGWKEDLQRLSAEDLRAYYERHYGPNRAFLVIVGAFDVSKTIDRVHELFDPLRAVPSRESVLAEPEPRGERRAVVRTPGTTRRLALGVTTSRCGGEEDFVLDVLAAILGGGRSSRLYRDLVLDRELATDVSVFNEARLDPGMLWIFVELRPGVDPRVVEERVQEQLSGVAARGVRADELRRARAQILSGWLFEEETNLDVARRLGRFESVVADGHRLIASVPARYEAVSSGDVREVVARYLRPERFVVIDGEPEEMSPPRHRVARKRRSSAGRTAPGPGKTEKKVRAAKKTRASRAKKRPARKGTRKDRA